MESCASTVDQETPFVACSRVAQFKTSSCLNRIDISDFNPGGFIPVLIEEGLLVIVDRFRKNKLSLTEIELREGK